MALLHHKFSKQQWGISHFSLQMGNCPITVADDSAESLKIEISFPSFIQRFPLKQTNKLSQLVLTYPQLSSSYSCEGPKQVPTKLSFLVDKSPPSNEKWPILSS